MAKNAPVQIGQKATKVTTNKPRQSDRVVKQTVHTKGTSAGTRKAPRK
jgi:hypothetical protein